MLLCVTRCSVWQHALEEGHTPGDTLRYIQKAEGPGGVPLLYFYGAGNESGQVLGFPL